MRTSLLLRPGHCRPNVLDLPSGERPGPHNSYARVSCTERSDKPTGIQTQEFNCVPVRVGSNIIMIAKPTKIPRAAYPIWLRCFQTAQNALTRKPPNDRIAKTP